jgi:RHS repeat-associated protein
MDDVEAHVEMSEVTGSVFDTSRKGWYTYVKDQVGTVYKVYSDYHKQIVDTRAYDTFGNLINQNGSSNGNLGFQGKYFDQESGLYYFYHRYYSTEMGRFITEDPIHIRGGLNMYSFEKNDPINTLDFSGLNPIKKFRSCVNLMIKLTEAKYPEYADDLRHCYASCMIAKNCGGTLLSGFVGVMKEIRDIFKKGDPEWRDLINNAKGNICASVGIHKSIKDKMKGGCCNVKKGQCAKCCECLKNSGFLN